MACGIRSKASLITNQPPQLDAICHGEYSVRLPECTEVDVRNSRRFLVYFLIPARI
jgi:hypothetical protein